jgi:hypothetical protein
MQPTSSNIDARAATINHIGGHQTIITNNIVTSDAAQLEQALRLHNLNLNHTLPASNSRRH